MMYFNTYPVTANMGLRESIDAMLSHVAYNGRDFGYLPSAVHEANYEGLTEDYATILDTSGDSPTLAPRITDSALLDDLVYVLVGLCNDYPAYDDERVTNIEDARLLDMLNEVHKEGEPEPEHVMRALFEIGAYIEHSEYGVNVSESDYENAVSYAREHFSA